MALVLLCGPLTGCVWSGKTWSFSITRAALDEVERHTFEYRPRGAGMRGGTDELWIPGAIVLGPIAADIALLPITGVHDLWVK